MRMNPVTPTVFSVVSLATLATTGAAVHGALAPAFPIQTESGLNQDGTTLMVVNVDTATLRCGDQDVFYAMAQLQKGAVLQTAGTSGSFTIVIVPKHIGAFVPAAEVNAGSKPGTVSLKVDSKLRAPSQLLGLSGSWKQMYPTPLPSGTELSVLETLKNEAGSVVGYRVIAPTGAKGELPVAYVKTDALRPALDSEAQAFAQGQGQVRGSNPAQPKPQAAKPEPKPQETKPAQAQTAQRDSQSETGSATQPQASTQANDEPQGVDDSLLEEMALPTEQASEPVEIANRTPRKTAEEGRISSSALEDLEAAFARAREMPREELDEALGELLAEFQRTRAEAEPGSSLARALDQRIEWINIRIITRDQRREIAQTLATYDANADELAQAVEAWQQGRAYQLVGRMVTSSVYTGKNLPLLYRIQGIDPITGSPRTIGYVAPRANQDLRHMLGRVVGVIGTRTDDASLKLTVVQPERVDPMPQ